jgi:hypothetical protein
MMKFGITTLAATLLMATGALAQDESSNRVAAVTDWSVFVDGTPVECWGVSQPKETINSDENGNLKAVTRGKILLFVTYKQGGGAAGEVSFTGGYAFAGGSTVKLNVGDAAFDLFTDGEWGWSASAAEDEKIIAAMKRGSSAILTARSARGTITKDTFSLLGFTAALDEAIKRCAG